MKGVVPTGGRGTRMRPITFSANKHLVPVGNKPLIYYPIEALVSAGVTDIALTYNPGQLDQVKNFLGNGSRWGAKFTYVLQPEPKGLANIVQVCEQFINGEPFIFHLGDNIFTSGVFSLTEYFQKKHPHGLLAIVHHPENSRLGVPYYDKQGRLVKLVEKPAHPPHDLAVPGVYLADRHFFACFQGADAIRPSSRGEYEITDAFQWLLDHHYRVDTVEIPGRWLDPGKFDDWIETNRFLLDSSTTDQIDSPLNKSVVIEGRVTIGTNCLISNSHIRGPVNIGNHVTIQNSFVGPFTSIYHHCHIDSCQLENSVLMEGVKLDRVPHPIDSSLIGPGSIVSHNTSNHGRIKFFLGESNQIEL